MNDEGHYIDDSFFVIQYEAWQINMIQSIY